MTEKTKQRSSVAHPVVEVVVSHNDLRRGERGEVELTDEVRALLDKGYMRLVDDPEGAQVPANPLGTTAQPRQAGGVLLGVDAGGVADDSGRPVPAGS